MKKEKTLNETMNNFNDKIDEINNHMSFDLLKRKIELYLDYIFLPILIVILIMFITTDNIVFLISGMLLEIIYFITSKRISKLLKRDIKSHEIMTYILFKQNMPLSVFEYLVEDIDVEKYHICRKLDENGYVKEWIIYKKKGLTDEEFYSPRNKPIISSKKNSFLDLVDFVENPRKFVKRGKKDARNIKRSKKKND